MELRKTLDSFPHFLANYVWIKDEQEQTTFKLEPWPWQLEFAKSIVDPNQRFHVILKARQLGLTWICMAYGVWLMLRPHANILVLSKTQEDAFSALGRAHYIYSMLPDWLRPPLMKKNEHMVELGFDFNVDQDKYINDSKMRAFSATSDAGRSETGTVVINDEWAFHPKADDSWQAMYPTIERAGRFIGISTANGTGNLLHDMYWGGKQGENDFKSYFFSFKARPDRDETWYENAKRNASDDRKFRREYPRTDIEAFLTTGGSIFNVERLQEMEDNAQPEVAIPSTFVQLTALKKDHNLEVYEMPSPSESYVSGTDVSLGRTESSDYSVHAIMNSRSKKLVAMLHGHYGIKEFAALVVKLNVIYNTAFWGPETTFGLGDALLVDAFALNYPRDRVYHWTDRKMKSAKKKKVPGWSTNRRTKPLMEENMMSGIKTGNVIICSKKTINELKNYIEDPDTKKTGAVGKNKDDRAIAVMIAYYLSFEPEALAVPGRRKQRIAPDMSQRRR